MQLTLTWCNSLSRVTTKTYVGNVTFTRVYSTYVGLLTLTWCNSLTCATQTYVATHMYVRILTDTRCNSHVRGASHTHVVQLTLKWCKSQSVVQMTLTLGYLISRLATRGATHTRDMQTPRTWCKSHSRGAIHTHLVQLTLTRGY